MEELTTSQTMCQLLILNQKLLNQLTFHGKKEYVYSS